MIQYQSKAKGQRDEAWVDFASRNPDQLAGDAVVEKFKEGCITPKRMQQISNHHPYRPAYAAAMQPHPSRD